MSMSALPILVGIKGHAKIKFIAIHAIARMDLQGSTVKLILMSAMKDLVYITEPALMD
jgi:hypothetical protein